MSRNKKHGASDKPMVDVVIITGGRWDYLRQCLEALKNQPVPVNIIVLDNACDMQEKNRNIELFDGISTKRLPEHHGYPAANNEAARMGSAPLILFLNDDCIVTQNTIAGMVETMKDQTIGVCGAKLLFPLNSTSPIRPAGKVQHIGISLNIRGDTFHALNGWSADNPKTCYSRDVFAVTGACLLIRRSLFNRVRGFDPIFGMGTYEDVDLCLKVREVGSRIYVNASAIAYHYTGATSEKKQTGYPIQVNASIFRNKWMHSPLMMWDEFSWW